MVRPLWVVVPIVSVPADPVSNDPPAPTVIAVPLTVKLLPNVNAPAEVRLLVGLKKLMLPVLASPTVKVCLLVVASVPVALMYRPPVRPAEREAVGVPPAMLVTANLAELVAVEPSKRS